METRSKKVTTSESGIDMQQRVFTEPSQPPPKVDSVRAACRLPSPTCSGVSRHTVRSVRSTASIQLRIKQAEFEAQQRLAEIRRKELQIEAELVSKRLELQISDIQAEEDELVNAPKNDAAERVGHWLWNSNVATVPRRNVSDAPPSNTQPLCPAAPNEIDARTQARGSTPSREIQELAAVLKSMQHTRAPPRQACELPLFTGAASEWLPFRAAVRDSTTLYNFSAVENVARLRACLRGEAREAVSALLYTATDPDAIMRTLEQYYGRPEIIVDRAMEDIKQLPRPGNSPHELNKLAVKLQNIVCVLQNIDQQDYLQNPMLVREVTEKLSPHLASRWCDYACENQDEGKPKIVLLSQFLMREADRTIQHLLPVAANTQGAKRPSKPPTAAISRHRRAPEAVYASDERTKHPCACCGKHHAITKCGTLKKMNTDQRWEWAKKSGTCFKCLNGSHRRSECSSKLCGVNKCRRPHHPLLHTEPRTAREANEYPDRAAPAEAVLSAAANETQASPVLLKVCPVLVSGPRGEIHTYALLDEGSTVTMIDEGLAQELGADGPTQPLRLRSVNSTQDQANSKQVKFSIKGIEEPESYVIRARTLNNLSLRNQTVARDVAKFKHLRTLRGRLSYENARPRILIGTDNWQLIVTRQLRTGKKSEPAASRTRLGWVVHGTLPRRVLREGPGDDSVRHVSTWEQHQPETDDLAALVKSHYDIDALGVSSRKKERAEDRRAIEMFEQSARIIDGRYEVGLPWRSDEVAMPRNYDYALKRLRSIERKMDKDPAFRREYTSHTDNITADARWFNGPGFLRNPENTWPSGNNTTVPDEEVVAVATTEESYAPCLPQIKRFSSYTRLLRSTAYVLLFIERCKRMKSKLEVRHIKRAAELWAMQAQRDDFSDDIRRIQRGERLTKTSRLYKLDPTMESGVLRVRGRIDAANAAYDMRRPIILDGRHRLSRLLVEHEHRAAGHGNHERVINELRQRFWILHLRSTVRAVARDCQYCKIRRAAPTVPTRGNLPPERLADRQRPFTCCAVDYFGPMLVAVGRRREKRWGALFTCLTTRAVHLELVSGLSADIAIMALRRMAARRGWPRGMYSDNGTNFRGADTELQAAYAEWAPRLQQYGMTKGMDWKFIPPGAPHMGGAWERLVRSIKNALAVTLREKVPREETLHTLLVEAEHSVNSRPLTHVYVDPDDPEALTPNHFLFGTSSALPIYGPYAEASRASWKQTQALADEFWRRWLVEYLPTLVPRGGADNHGRSLQRGDLVVAVDPAMPRNVWPRGVVERTYPGPDNKVRVADVRTNGGIFRRPANKLAVLRTEKEAARREEDVADVEQGHSQT